MRRLSLKLRLTIVFAAVMALLLGAIGAVLYSQLESTLDEQIDASLAARSDSLAALVRRGDGELVAGTPLAEEDEAFAQVLGPDGAVLDATANVRAVTVLAGGRLEQARREILRVESTEVPGAGDNPFRLLAMPVERRGGAAVLIAGASLEDRDEALAKLRTLLLVGGPLALGLASLAAYLLAAAALRPVEAMRSRAAEITARDAARRLPEPAGKDEIARLARTLNQMLGRLEAGLARERRFVAEAGHELRTPLTTLKAELELALRRPRTRAELEAALASAAEETERLTQLAEDLLLLARSDEGALRLEPSRVDGVELLETVARRFRARAEAEGRAIVVDRNGPVPVDVDRLRLEQALGNLLDNALRHGAGTIRLAASTSGGRARLTVEDGGPGVPESVVPAAFERFTRGEASRGTHAGAGLGLAIVAAITKAHGGEASLAGEPRSRVTLSLPAAASSPSHRDPLTCSPSDERLEASGSEALSDA